MNCTSKHMCTNPLWWYLCLHHAILLIVSKVYNVKVSDSSAFSINFYFHLFISSSELSKQYGSAIIIDFGNS